MKKTALMILMACIACLALLAFTACDLGGDDTPLPAPHTHTLIYHEAVLPECTTTGTAAHYECSSCGELFRDERGTERIFEEDELILPIYHAYFDEVGVCRCGYHQGTEGLVYTKYETYAELHRCPVGGTVVIASEYEGLPVTSIHQYAFNDAPEITDIRIPPTFTEFQPLWCSLLQSAKKVENGIVYIDKWAVGYTEELDSVIYLRGDTVGIANGAFNYANMQTVNLPHSLLHIDGFAFFKCKSLSLVVMSECLQTIGDCAFTECSALPSISLPDTLTTIGRNAFADCTALTELNIPDSVCVMEYQDYTRYMHLVTEATVEGFFYKGVYYLDNWAIGHKSVPGSYSESAYYTTLMLKEDTVGIAEEAFKAYHGLYLVINESMKYIGKRAFYLSDFKTANLSTTVTVIDDGAFEGCWQLDTIDFPDVLEKIGANAFKDCGNLRGVTLPHDRIDVDESAFDEKICQVTYLNR